MATQVRLCTAVIGSLLALAATVEADATQPGVSRQGPAEEAALLAQSRQLVVVETPGWDSPQGTLRRFERSETNRRWQPVGSPLPAWIGRAGAAWRSDRSDDDREPLTGPKKREGDGRSPAGLFALGDLWGYAATAPPSVRLRYHAIDDRDRCVDDAAAPAYNQLMRAQDASGSEPWQSAERLRLSTDHYKLLVPIDYNRLLPHASATERPRPGAGSCIFLHIAPPPGAGTAGCTALAESDLLQVLRFLDPAKQPLLLLLPRPAWELARARWGLPAELASATPPSPRPQPASR